MIYENWNNDGRTIGYARVSTSEQDLRLQFDALKKHGLPKEMIFADKASGSKEDRRGLEACLAELREGDVLLGWRLDRLGRSIRHLVSLIDELKKRGVGLRSICDGAIDTTSASGELIFHVFSALAHFERGLSPNARKRDSSPLVLVLVGETVVGRNSIRMTRESPRQGRSIVTDRSRSAKCNRTLEPSRLRGVVAFSAFCGGSAGSFAVGGLPTLVLKVSTDRVGMLRFPSMRRYGSHCPVRLGRSSR